MPHNIIVTGGSGLIGTHICRYFQEQGWMVVSFDTQAGPKDIKTIECDIGDEKSVKEAYKSLGWERIDLLVNNAAEMNDFEKGFEQTEFSTWEKVIRTNLTGTYLMSRTALKYMKDDGGCIINMASTRAMMSEGGDFPYAASKGGIISLTQAMAISLGPNIRVNAIAPGWISDKYDLRTVDHEQHPAGRVGRPHDISEAVNYLFNAGFITGQTLTIDGGMTKKMIYAE